VWAPLTPIGQCAFLERNDRKGDGSLFCGLRRKTVLIVCLFAVLLAAGVALASVGKFSRVTSSATFSTSTTAAATSSGASSAAALSGATATSTTLSAVLTVNFTESGLGNVGDSDVVTATASSITTTYFCVNGGGNNPKASNKTTIPGPPASGSGTFQVTQNGKITGQVTLSASPADLPGTFACPSGQTTSVFMTFAGITLHDETTGGNGVAPDATTNTVSLG
jgi:hypothetical protein